MAINSREDANKYYQVINGLVDDYLDKWKIRPSNLKRYLQPGSERFNKFLERNKLKEIKGADVILKDIIEDRNHMESDGVITFENFKFFESDEFKISTLKECLYKGIDKATIEYEKVIADHFDTNLGDIDVVDSDKHLFKINDWQGEDVKVVIYNKEDIDIIKHNMINHLFLELTKKSIEIIDGLKVELSDMIKFEVFEDEMNNRFDKEEFLIKTINKCLGGDFKFKKEFKEYYIWISENM
jgi:hypothetical protein